MLSLSLASVLESLHESGLSDSDILERGLLEEYDDYYRVCDVCGKIMLEGYYDGDGTGKYYCSDECLLTDYESVEYWSENIYSDDGDSYYTEWGY